MFRGTQSFIGFGVGKPDILGPVITSSTTVSVPESVRLAFTVTTNEEATIVIGGPDAGQVEFDNDAFSASRVLRWKGRGIKDYETPEDANGDNVYSITLTGTDYFDNIGTTYNLAITVTDIVVEDPNWTKVVFLAGYEGTSGTNQITDESLYLHGTGSPSGSGNISTAQFKYGTSSYNFIPNSSLRWISSTDYHFGAGKFTVEAWVRPTTITGQQFFVAQWPSAAPLGWVLWMNAGALSWSIGTTPTDNIAQLTGGTLTVGNWYHVCVDYDGTKYRLYLNGVMTSSSTVPRIINSLTANLALGSNSSVSGLFYNGFMDEVRITKGMARYATDTPFTPPTAAFPRAGGPPWVDPFQDALVMTFDGTTTNHSGYSGRQVVLSSLITRSGSGCRLILAHPSTGSGWSIGAMWIGEQAATGDPYDMKSAAQVKVGGSTTFALSTIGQTLTTDPINYPIEMGKNYVISMYFSSTTNLPWVQTGNTAVGFFERYPGSPAEAATLDVTNYNTINTGYFVLVQRIQVTNDPVDVTIPNLGFVDVDVIHAPRRATTEPYWPETVFIIGYEGTLTEESMYFHGTGTVTGSGAISTAQKKFGTSSFAFDGASSVKWPNHSDYDFGAGKFTVETFVRFNNLTGLQAIMGHWPSSPLGWILYSSLTVLKFNVSTDGANNIEILSGGTLTANAWHHVCVDFDGSKYRMYLNGVMVASSTTLRTIQSTPGQLALGSDGNTPAGLFLNGFLDETRITKNVARYASDSGFTVPTSAYIRG